MISKIKYWLPAILYMALIYYLSSRPANEALRRFPIIAKLKVVHIIEYGTLYYLLWRAIIKTTTYNRTESIILALSTMILYGLTDELHQVFVVGRTASLVDVVANGVGGVIFSLRNILRN